MQGGGIQSKLSYKQQVIQLTSMLQNTLRQLSDTTSSSSLLQSHSQKLKHSLQQKDVRIRFLESEIKKLVSQYQILEKSVRLREEEEVVSVEKSMKLSRLCNGQLENELEYLKSENAGLVGINEEYLRELEEMRRWREGMVGEKRGWQEKVGMMKKEIEKKEEQIREYQGEIQRMKEVGEGSGLRLSGYLEGEEGEKQEEKRGEQSRQQPTIDESRDLLVEEISNLREQNLNIRSQLLILRQRNELIQQKYIQLQRQLQNRITLSTKQSQAFSHLIQDIHKLQAQVFSKDTQLTKIQEDVVIKTQQLKMMMEEREDLAVKIEDSNLALQRKSEEITNLRIEHDIEVEELRQYHQQEMFSLKRQHQQMVEERYQSYTSVKQELIRVKKYLESEDGLESPQKVTELEAENLRMAERIRSLEEQLAMEENLFHLSDRTPLVMISETTLFDFEISKEEREKKRELKLEESIKIEKMEISEEYPLEKKIREELNQEKAEEQKRMIQDLNSELQQKRDEIVGLEEALKRVQMVLLERQEMIVSQKKEIMEISGINRELDELEKLSREQVVEYEEVKRLNREYVEKIEGLNRDVGEIERQVWVVVEKVQQRFGIKSGEGSQLKLNDIIQYFNSEQAPTDHQSVESPSPQMSVKPQLTSSQTQTHEQNLEVCQQCIICQDRMRNIQDLIGINTALNTRIDQKSQEVQELQQQLGKIQSTQSQHLSQVTSLQQNIKSLEESIHAKEEEIEQHNSQIKQRVDEVRRVQQLLHQEIQKNKGLQSQLQERDSVIEIRDIRIETLIEDTKNLAIELKELQMDIQQSQVTATQEKDNQHRLTQYHDERVQLLEKIRVLEEEIEQIKLESTLQATNNLISNNSINVPDPKQEENQRLQQTIQQLEANLEWAQSEIQKQLQIINNPSQNKLSHQGKQNDAALENTISPQNPLLKENQQLKARISQLQREQQPHFISQKHKYSITPPQQTLKSKQKRIIEKLKIQISTFTRRQQLLIQDRKQLKQEIFLAKRELETAKQDLTFEKKRNTNLQQLYDRFRKSKHSEISKHQSILTNPPS